MCTFVPNLQTIANIFYFFRCYNFKMNVITKSIQLPDGRTITIETGKVAKQADGSYCLCRKRCSSRNRFHASAG